MLLAHSSPRCSRSAPFPSFPRGPCRLNPLATLPTRSSSPHASFSAPRWLLSSTLCCLLSCAPGHPVVSSMPRMAFLRSFPSSFPLSPQDCSTVRFEAERVSPYTPQTHPPRPSLPAVSHATRRRPHAVTHLVIDTRDPTNPIAAAVARSKRQCAEFPWTVATGLREEKGLLGDGPWCEGGARDRGEVSTIKWVGDWGS